MQLRLVHDELQKCHRAEGENHYQVCAPIAKLYKDLLKEAKVLSSFVETHMCRSRASAPWMHSYIFSN